MEVLDAERPHPPAGRPPQIRKEDCSSDLIYIIRILETQYPSVASGREICDHEMELVGGILSILHST